MATTAVLWGSGTPVTTASAGTWSGATNAAGSNNGTFATWSSVAANANGTIRVEGYGAQTAIGATPASVDSVSVTVYNYVTNVSRMVGRAVQLTSAGTLFGTSQLMTGSTTTTNSQTFTFTGVTWAQLASLGVRLTYTRGNVTTAADALVDAISIAVTYTPAAATASTFKVYNGSAWVNSPLKRWNGSAWVDCIAKRYNGSTWVDVP